MPCPKCKLETVNYVTVKTTIGGLDINEWTLRIGKEMAIIKHCPHCGHELLHQTVASKLNGVDDVSINIR